MRDANSETPNPDPNSGYNERDCPYCPATVKNLPAHLRNHCENIPTVQEP